MDTAANCLETDQIRYSEVSVISMKCSRLLEPKDSLYRTRPSLRIDTLIPGMLKLSARKAVRCPSADSRDGLSWLNPFVWEKISRVRIKIRVLIVLILDNSQGALI